MRTERFELRIREVPRSLNAGGAGSRMHWAAAHREKKRWERLFLAELMIAKVPKGMVRADSHATIRWRRRRRRDAENYRPAISKPWADALVAGGYLADDTAEFYELTGPDFEYPDQTDGWAGSDPRFVGELVIALTATYEED